MLPRLLVMTPPVRKPLMTPMEMAASAVVKRRRRVPGEMLDMSPTCSTVATPPSHQGKGHQEEVGHAAAEPENDAGEERVVGGPGGQVGVEGQVEAPQVQEHQEGVTTVGEQAHQQHRPEEACRGEAGRRRVEGPGLRPHVSDREPESRRTGRARPVSRAVARLMNLILPVITK